MFYLLITLIGILDAIAGTTLKVWATTGKTLYFVLGVGSFALAGVFFAFSMHYKGLAIANILWIGFSAIALTLIAIIFFQETFS